MELIGIEGCNVTVHSLASAVVVNCLESSDLDTFSSVSKKAKGTSRLILTNSRFPLSRNCLSVLA